MRIRAWAPVIGAGFAALLLAAGTAAPASATSDDTPPTAPGTLRVTGTTQSTASLSWTESTDDGPYVSYRVFVDGALWAFLTPIPSINSQTTTTLRHLTPGTAYAITVRAADSAGNLSAPSNTVIATTQPSTDQTPPTTPALRITRDIGCAVTLAWTASSDNVEPASAIEYEIVVNGIIQRLVVGATTTTAYHTNLNGSNTFAVRALDRSGNISPPSNPVTSVFQEC